MMGSKAKIAYFGSDAICLPGLRHLHEACRDVCELALVITQPDRRQGRGKQLKQNPVAAYASAEGLPLLQPAKPDRQLAARIVEADISVAFVMAYGHFLPKSLREAPRHGMLNFHGSVLPAYRGASPVETALAMGDKSTGLCLMQVVREMDAGGVADCEPVAILDDDTGPELRARMGSAAVPLIERNLAQAVSGELSFQPQDDSAATYCRKITKQDGAIDFTQPAQRIDTRRRAFTPWPGAFFEWQGTMIKVGQAEALPVNADALPGTVLRAGQSLDVATAEGVIAFWELQRPGGRLLPAEEFLRGFPILPGERLPSVTTPPLCMQ